MSAVEMADRLAAGMCPGDCGRLIKTGRLACPYHWSLLPIALRSQINAALQLRSDHLRCTHPFDKALADTLAALKGEAFHFWATGQWDPS